MVAVCLMWLIWQECNTSIFEDIERPLDLVKSLLVKILFVWSCIWGLTHCISICDFLQSISISFWFVCIHFKYSAFTIVNMLFIPDVSYPKFFKKIVVSLHQYPYPYLYPSILVSIMIIQGNLHKVKNHKVCNQKKKKKKKIHVYTIQK